MKQFVPMLARYAGIDDQTLLENDVRLHLLLEDLVLVQPGTLAQQLDDRLAVGMVEQVLLHGLGDALLIRLGVIGRGLHVRASSRACGLQAAARPALATLRWAPRQRRVLQAACGRALPGSQAHRPALGVGFGRSLTWDGWAG